MGPTAFEFAALEAPVPARAAAPAEVLAAARADAEAIRAAARAEGFAEGHAAGLAAVEERLAPAAAALAEAHAGTLAERERMTAAVEEHAVELALHLAERVLAGALAAQPERVLDVVRGALRCLVDRERVVVLVHPDDLELVRTGAGELIAGLGGIASLDVQAERRVARGGAVVRTALGEVDAQLETKLARAREAIEAALA